jgi:hypothetical protein
MKLLPWHLALVYLALGLVTLTGGGWLVCHYLLAEAGELGPLPHPREGAWLAAHGISALVMTFVFGSLLFPHFLRGWSLRKSRGNGAALVAVLTLLSASGAGLYYVADDDWRGALGRLHWGLGLALPLLVLGHVWWGRRNNGREA